MDNLEKQIAKVIAWLKTNGEQEMDGKNYSFTCQDEPYMRFHAEWQDWDSGKTLLFVGYSFKQNGDICYDPQFQVEKDGLGSKLSMTLAFGRSQAVESPSEREFALQFLQTVYKRHMEGRRIVDGENT